MNTASPTHPQAYRADIDGLRAVAVLAVLFFHAFPHDVPGGFIGVDVFFVISGFLIGRIILEAVEQGRFSFVEFYARRVRRIFPALLVVLAAVLVLGWVILLADEYTRLGSQVYMSGTFRANILFFLDADYFDVRSEAKPLLHLWSLSVEEQFYFVWPLLLYGAHRLKAKRLMAPAAMFLFSFFWCVAATRENAVAAFFLLPARFWELAAGTVAAHFSLRSDPVQPSAARSHALSLLGISLILAGFFGLSRSILFPGGWALIPVAGTSLVIAAGPNAWLNRRVLAAPILTAVGLISYPLYLWHWPLLSLARIVDDETPPPALRVGLLMTAFVLAWATYHFIELRIRVRRERRVAVLLVAACAVVTAGGYAVNKAQGVRSRGRESAGALPADHSFEAQVDTCRRRFPYAMICAEAGSDAPEQVLLLGDSHARALFPGLESARGNRGLLLLGENGSPPLLDFAAVERRMPQYKDRALETADRSLRYAATSPRVHTVVLAFRGTLYVTGQGFGDIDEADRMVYQNGERQEAGPRPLQAALRETLTLLTSAGKRVIFAVDVPELGFDPRSCVDYRAFAPGKALRTPCAVPRTALEARRSAYRQAVDPVLREFPVVEIFDPTPLLCDATYCWAMRDGQLLYRDDDHLSYPGSLLIGNALGRMIESKAPHSS